MSKEFAWTDELVAEYSLASQSLTIFEFKRKKESELREWEIIQVSSPECGLYYLEGYKMRHNDRIYSVKRLADGEVFTIGDNVKYTAGMCNYDSYTIDNFFIRGDGRLLVRSGGAIVEYISDISKAKSIQFTTEDGVCIYKGDDYYFINTEWEIRYTGDNYMWIGDNLKAFSSEKAAQEYILMNKPLLSVNNVIDILQGTYYLPELIEKARNNKP